MPRAATLGHPAPYAVFGSFAGLAAWGGGDQRQAAAPGLGKTSWALRLVAEAAAHGLPAALGCYEHSAEELKFRLQRQAEAVVAGAHAPAPPQKTEAQLARWSEVVLLPLDDQEDTVRALEDSLLTDYGFPPRGPALVVVDYLNRVPVVGLTGPVPPEQRAGEAALALRALAKRHSWALVAAAALKTAHFAAPGDLSALLGDERVPYTADRVLLLRAASPPRPCRCFRLSVHTLKDRTGPVRTWALDFWGERFYPALEDEAHQHDAGGETP